MEQLVNFIIRPPRAEYDPEHDLLDQEFMLKGKWYKRKDVEVKNNREDALRCSHYIPIVNLEAKALPCVIYCHGNSGCRADASEAAIMLLPLNITVFTLDFSGSGLSGGEHVTLGWNEKDDLKAVVDYLRSDGNVSMIGLWGRSMGAVTSLMYGAEDPSIAGMVLDSPFSDLVDLMMELVDTYKVRLPKFTVKFAIQYMRRAIQKKAKFDITDLNTIKVAKSCFVPVLLGHAIDDDFIQPHHSDRIFDAYVGDKNIIKFDGDHNSPRPQFYFDSISIFFKNVLQPPDDDLGEAFLDTTVHMHDYIDKASWDALRGLGYTGGLTVTPKAATSSTGNATGQLRPKRAMSRMEVPADIALTNQQQEVKYEATGDGSSQSSSGMISFDLSNGHPDGSDVPAFIDDDQYVEYPLDYSADFPTDVEEEQRMLMEAMMESLKDLDTRQPHDEDPSSTEGSGFVKSSQKSELEAPSTIESCRGTESGSVTTSAPDGDTVKIERRCPDAGSYVSSPVSESMSSGEPTKGSSTCNPPHHGETPKSVSGSTSSDDSAQCTKATVTVVKSPSNTLMDGLFKRWDRNIFKSNRQN